MLDEEHETLVRKMNGEKTVQEIVKETSEAFARRLHDILKRKRSSDA